SATGDAARVGAGPRIPEAAPAVRMRGQMKFQKRSVFGWGASGAARATPRKGLVIHYDGSNQGLARKAHTSCVAYWKATRRFHMGPARGWADIGYSFGACPHGYVMEGRGLDRIQAAQPGGNDTWYSVTLMSGPGEDPTPAQIDAVRQLRQWLMGKGVAGAVRGHRDFIPTSCPRSGYSFGACPHGYVMEGRGLDRIQAAQPGGNDTWYSVTLMSGPGEDPTPAQIDAVRQLRQWLMGKGVAGAVRGHRDFIPTSCPGDRLYRLVKNGTFSKAPSEEDDDMQLNDKVKIKDWVRKRWPKDAGLADGAISVNTAFGSGYAYSRIAAEGVERLVPLVEAQGAAIREMAAALAARDEAVDVDALVARITEQIERVTVRLDVQTGDGE